MSKSKKTPLLSAEQEIALARRVHGTDRADSLAARNELVLSNLGLVGKVAAHWKRRWPDADYDELFAEGCMALVRAAELFDPDMHFRFSTYACPSISHRLKKYLEVNRRALGLSEDSDLVPLHLDPRPEPLDTLCRADDRADVLRALEQLTPLQAYILAHRRGLCGLERRSMYALGRELGLSGERIRQIEWKAVARVGRTLRRWARPATGADEKRCA